MRTDVVFYLRGASVALMMLASLPARGWAQVPSTPCSGGVGGGTEFSDTVGVVYSVRGDGQGTLLDADAAPCAWLSQDAAG